MEYPQNLASRPVFGKLNLNVILSLAGIIGPIILVITDYFVALSTPDYDFIENSISSLAWTRWGFIQTIGFLALGLFTELFVAGLFFSLIKTRWSGAGLGILVIFGFGLLLIGAFHTNPVGTSTIEGSIHQFTAKTIFWLFPLAIILIAPSLKKDANWRSLYKYSVIAAIISVIIMFCLVLIPIEKGWFGLIERLLVIDEIIWVEIMAIRLLRLSIKNHQLSKYTLRTLNLLSIWLDQ